MLNHLEAFPYCNPRVGQRQIRNPLEGGDVVDDLHHFGSNGWQHQIGNPFERGAGAGRSGDLQAALFSLSWPRQDAVLSRTELRRFQRGPTDRSPAGADHKEVLSHAFSDGYTSIPLIQDLSALYAQAPLRAL